MMRLALVIAVLVLAVPALASTGRSHAIAREFQREHPCPSTGLPSGACPGWIKDYIVPLACCGPDAVAHLQMADGGRGEG